MPSQPTLAQEGAFRELCRHATAVARQTLPSGAVSLIARNARGAIVDAQVVDRTGDVLAPDAVLAELGDARRQADVQRAHAVDALVAHLALAGADGRSNGGELNPTAVAIEAGLSRTVIYRRVASTKTTQPTA